MWAVISIKVTSKRNRNVTEPKFGVHFLVAVATDFKREGRISKLSLRTVSMPITKACLDTRIKHTGDPHGFNRAGVHCCQSTLRQIYGSESFTFSCRLRVRWNTEDEYERGFLGVGVAYN